MDLSDVELLYIDETSSKKGHSYVTLVCDQEGQIIFVCEGKSSETVYRLEAHNGRRENIGFISCNLGEAYPSGGAGTSSRLGSSTTRSMLWLIIEAMDDTVHRVVEIQAIKARTRHLMKMNVSKLSGKQLRALERPIEDYCELAETANSKTCSRTFTGSTTRSLHGRSWISDTTTQAFDTRTMRIAIESIYSRREGTLAWYDKSINNGFDEAVSNIQTTRKMARGSRNIDYFITMVYLCNGRLEISFD